MKVLNDLVGYKNLKIFQDTDWFSFSLDSVLLPNFVSIKDSAKNIVDFCTGNAPIPLILSTKTSAQIYGVEIQKDIFNLANETVIYNKLEKQIHIINEDVKNLKTIWSGDSVDVITCNPPYFRYSNKSILNEDEHKIIARHEKTITLKDIVSISKYLLKNNGTLAIVHRTDRLIEIIELFRNNNFEVKRLRFIYPKYNSESNMLLIEGRKNGRPGLKILSPLYIHNNDGSYTEEVLKMFKKSGD